MSDKSRQPGAPKPAAKAPAPAKPKPDEKFDFLSGPRQPGELGRLAHYRVLKVLGRGGMGTVFMAEDTRLHRTVGLKVMLPTLAKKQVAHDRFIREARATAAIEHDHIITIYEVNEANGVPYLSMQLLKGATLEDFLRVGKALNVPQIMRIGREIAKGLAAAHACKLVHRDIKPSNIWLDSTNKGRVKILDFGLVRPTDAETNLTQLGMVLGSPAYMSPEQATGNPVDERCDLFSLGCVLYRLCVGRLPFQGKDTTSMLLAITTEEPTPLREMNDSVPRALADLIHQMLAKKPEDRPASANEVVLRIQTIEREWIAAGQTQTMPTAPAPEAKEEYDVSLEESAITELELLPAQVNLTPTPQPPAPRGRGLLVAGLGGTLIVMVSVLCCLGLAMATDQGWVAPTPEDDAAKTFLDEQGVMLWDHHKKPHVVKSGKHLLASGGYDVDVGILPNGVEVKPSSFALHRGDTLPLKVRFKKTRPAVAPFTSDQAKKIQQEWASYLGVPVQAPLGDIKMILIPPGEFQMGSPKELLAKQLAELTKKAKEKKTPDPLVSALVSALQSESPQHLVRITKPFYLGECEVTYGQFMEFAVSASYTTLPEKSRLGGTGIENGAETTRKPEFNWKITGFRQTPEHPVCNIAWKDAETFCTWLSAREKKRCRLPTEAEWEYACRAGTTTLWYFADDIKEVNARDFLWYQPPPKGALISHSVGKKNANPFGLHDMHGNVEEMVADYWSLGSYAKSGADDPKGAPPAGKVTMRVARGGSFLEPAFQCRSASRNPVDPGTASMRIGFRVVCEIDEAVPKRE